MTHMEDAMNKTICALSNGFNVISKTAKLRKCPKDHLEPFKRRDVVITCDTDQPGQNYAARFAEDPNFKINPSPGKKRTGPPTMADGEE